jgi:hypothetical protein
VNSKTGQQHDWNRMSYQTLVEPFR